LRLKLNGRTLGKITDGKMRARGLELLLVSMGAVGAADIDGRNRQLREFGLLPIGGRGPHAPNILPGHTASMLLGLGSASVAAEAGKAAKRYAAFINHEDPKSVTLLERLTELLSDAARANEIEEVRICRTYPWVMIVKANGVRMIYRPRNEKHVGKKDSMTGGREEYVIGGGLLHQIAIDIAFKQGWAGEG
jgi:hypothetical protein